MTDISQELTQKLDLLQKKIVSVVKGKEQAIALVLTTIIADGHVLIEDVPGVGKTTLAKATAKTVGCEFKRVQFTADMLPSDLTGISIYNQKTAEFEFQPGPLFTQIVLADEINRASPRTQSALLEAMSEGRISIHGTTHDLDKPFLVFATQNPIESFGTYPLPDSQLDRFLMRISMGYPDPESEKAVLRERTSRDPVDDLEPVISREEFLQIQAEVELVKMKPELEDYLHEIVLETRSSPLLSVGISTRGSLLFHRAVRAYARLNGRNYVIPDDIKTLAPSCLAHRVVLSKRTSVDSWSESRSKESEQVILDILHRIVVPL